MNPKKNTRRVVFTLLSLPLLLVFLITFLYYTMPSSFTWITQQPPSVTNTIESNTSRVLLIIDYAGIKPNETIRILRSSILNNTTVFDLLHEHASITYTTYGNLVFINSINGVMNDETLKHYWWLYYVDGEYAQVAANMFYVGSHQVILWQYSKV